MRSAFPGGAQPPGPPSRGPAGAPSPDELARARLDPTRRLGPYVLLGELGRGGMGVVHHAWDERLARPVALKVVRGGDQAALKRFQREAVAVARLRHPNIVGVHQVGEADGVTFLAMDLIPGVALSHRLLPDQPRLPIPDALRIARDVARAVEHAHDRGVLHRDIKPHNIMLDPDGKPWVLDFGLAKLRDAGERLTKTRALLGTVSYMPPEQAQTGAANVDARSDVYAIGATLYEMLAGRPPFIAASEIEVMVALLERAPERPSAFEPGCAGDAETISLRCIEKDPDRRYQSAGELADDLDRVLAGEPIDARSESPAERIQRLVRKNATVLGAGAAVVVALAAVAFALSLASENRRLREAALASEANRDAPDRGGEGSATGPGAGEDDPVDVATGSGGATSDPGPIAGDDPGPGGSGGSGTATIPSAPDGPELEVVPVPSSTRATRITVTGRVRGSASTVTVNGADAPVDDGHFALEVDLAPGANAIEVVATDRHGERTTGEVAITRIVDEKIAPVPDDAWWEPDLAQRREAARLQRPLWFENELGMRFTLIPPGTFTMGSRPEEPGRDAGEAPHEVTITRAFYLGATEVTNAQLRRFRADHSSGSAQGHSLDGDDQPAAMTWHDAVALCAWLNAREDGHHLYRLPTEAEWEWAARAGEPGAWAWGDDVSLGRLHGNGNDEGSGRGYAAYPGDDGHRVAAPVGSYRPNRWGLHDVHGNAKEWCADLFGPYPAGPVVDPTGPRTGTARVTRGGGWGWPPADSRLASRGNSKASDRGTDSGLRLVAIPSDAAELLAPRHPHDDLHPARWVGRARSDALLGAADAHLAAGSHREAAVLAATALAARDSPRARITLARARGGAWRRPVDLPALEEAVGIEAVAFRPKGKPTVAYAATDGSIRVAGLEGTEPEVLAGSAPCRAIAWSDGGDVLLAGHEDGSVLAWRSGRKTPVATLSRHPAAVTDLDVSPDGRWIATGCDDGRIRIFAARHPTRSPAVVEPRKGRIAAVAFGPASRPDLLAVATRSGELLGWRLRGAEWDPVLAKRVTGAQIHALAWSPAGDRVAVGTEGRTVHIIELASGETSLVLEPHAGAVGDVAFSPEGQRLLAPSGGGEARIWDVGRGPAPASERLIATLRGLKQGYLSGSWSSDGRLVAVGGGPGGAPRIWRPHDPEGASAWRFHPTALVAIGTLEDRLLGMSIDGELRVIRRGTATTSRRIAGDDERDGDEPIRVTAATAVDDRVIVAFENGALVVERLDGKRSGAGGLLAAGEPAQRALATVSDGRHLIAGGETGTIAAFDLRRRRLIAAAETAHAGPVTAVAPDGRDENVFSGGEDGAVLSWKLAELLAGESSPRELASGRPVRSLASGPSVLAVGRADGVLELLRSVRGEDRIESESIPRLHEEPLIALAIRSDGWLAATDGARVELRLIGDGPGGSASAPFMIPPEAIGGRVTTLAFVDGGTRLALGGADGVLRLWPMDQLTSAKLDRASLRAEVEAATGLRVPPGATRPEPTGG